MKTRLATVCWLIFSAFLLAWADSPSQPQFKAMGTPHDGSLASPSARAIILPDENPDEGYEESEYYLAGAYNSWQMDENSKFRYTDQPGILTISVDRLPSSFKISGRTWAEADFGGDYSPLYVGVPYSLVEGGLNIQYEQHNMVVENAKVTFNTYDFTITVEGRPTYRAERFFFKNSNTNWEPDASNELVDDDHDGIFVLRNYLMAIPLGEDYGHFKIATDDWSIEYGFGNMISSWNLSTTLSPILVGSYDDNNCSYNIEGYYDIYWNYSSNVISFQPSTSPSKPTENVGSGVYIRGSFNGWDALPEYEFLTTNKHTLILENVEIPGGAQFKIASKDWTTVNYGAPEYYEVLLPNQIYTLERTDNNICLSKDFKGDVIFELDNANVKFISSETPSDPDIPSDPVISGDANGDGDVNITDVVYIVNHILEKDAADFNSEAADMNGDGDVNVTDIVFIINIILGK